MLLVGTISSSVALRVCPQLAVPLISQTFPLHAPSPALPSAAFLAEVPGADCRHRGTLPRDSESYLAEGMELSQDEIFGFGREGLGFYLRSLERSTKEWIFPSIRELGWIAPFTPNCQCFFPCSGHPFSHPFV